MVDDPLKSFRQTADIMGCSVGTVRNLVEKGHLQPVRISERVVRFHLADIHKYIQSASGSPPPDGLEEFYGSKQ